MALTTQLGHRIPYDIQSRGRDYYQRGAVEILDGNAWMVEATVQGSQLYRVNLSRKGKVIQGACTCPYCQDNLEPCKHIWATLLAAERYGFLRGSGGEPRYFVIDDEEESVSEQKYDREDRYAENWQDDDEFDGYDPYPQTRPARSAA